MTHSETLETKDVTSEYQVKSLLDNMIFLNLVCVHFTHWHAFILRPIQCLS